VTITILISVTHAFTVFNRTIIGEAKNGTSISDKNVPAVTAAFTANVQVNKWNFIKDIPFAEGLSTAGEVKSVFLEFHL
jgi:hypothetical protein